MPYTSSIAWLLGRGVPVGCGLSWEVPGELYGAYQRGLLTRGELADEIRARLAHFQAARIARGECDTSAVDRLLRVLADAGGWRHAFVTTNWDTLVDRSMARHGHRVWHVNGSIEDRGEAFLTELDVRFGTTLGACPGFRAIAAATVCVLVGLSFRSALDQDLVERLGTLGGQRSWCVVNPDESDLHRTWTILHTCFPYSKITLAKQEFQDWVAAGLPELRGIIEAGSRRSTARGAL